MCFGYVLNSEISQIRVFASAINMCFQVGRDSVIHSAHTYLSSLTLGQSTALALHNSILRGSNSLIDIRPFASRAQIARLLVSNIHHFNDIYHHTLTLSTYFLIVLYCSIDLSFKSHLRVRVCTITNPQLQLVFWLNDSTLTIVYFTCSLPKFRTLFLIVDSRIYNNTYFF